MFSRLIPLLSLVLLVERAISVPLADPSPVASAAASAVSASLGGLTFVNKVSGNLDNCGAQDELLQQGLVGFGLIPSDFLESTGDTIGGIGSAIAVKRGTWTPQSDGTFTGTLVVHPDRGFNVYDYFGQRSYLFLMQFQRRYGGLSGAAARA